MSNTSDNSVIYYENWLMRKEAINTWVEYWVVVRKRWLQFFIKKENDRAELAKTLELTKFVQCSLIERNKRRFHFSIDNGHGKYYVKCNTELERYHWIFSILSSAKEQPKKPLPEHIPTSMTDKDAFKKPVKTFQKHPPFANPMENKTKSKEPSKRRQKYAKRAEDIAKKKREKKLAGTTQKLRPSSAMEIKHTEISDKINLRASSAMEVYNKHGDELHRTRRITSNDDDKNNVSIDKLSLNEDFTNIKISRSFTSIEMPQKSVNESLQTLVNERQQTSVNKSRQPPANENLQTSVNESRQIFASELQKKLNLLSEGKQPEEDLKVSSLFGVTPLKTQNKKVPPNNVMDNYAFQHEDYVSYSNTQGFINDDFSVLPNVLIDSCNEIDSACETFNDSQNSLISFCDLSSTKNSMLSPRNIGNFKASLENITSKTVLVDDIHFEQRGADGRVRSRSASICSNKSLLDLGESIT
ncbi:uncharacterized protein LOC136078039 [Hydra vulgaris]|uniref:Uncharacterized protein LOC136078039 n=1 Tax=Hydra vulgaris TaxID=6087 RepID=A0ABM4BIC4_HYDVU